jgi:hypothetical protein
MARSPALHSPQTSGGYIVVGGRVGNVVGTEPHNRHAGVWFPQNNDRPSPVRVSCYCDGTAVARYTSRTGGCTVLSLSGMAVL